ncbi:RNA 2',3'-cyclic phosphodiesterase [Anaerocolumna sp. AGMB13020]|uniref:RNA 2',3'-cyclic phosphodiesterase n=1 Tax=Anaerocolumna sp. AGMB13020 TaxID=3081750 RepID=UPI0029553FB3|nr:RNA 2',3'-cyclic phosphodiesterase [Anaerocolumna sp. AGMB13020]WOO35558.1 RNA 2',3'-cyclic phosphodiesterase [Anaerocolumna sp. AGMB13020]
MDKFYRLFAAIDFSEDQKERLYEYGRLIKKNSEKGSFTRKENFHLTLAFIGETRKLELVEEAVEEGVKLSRVGPFVVETEGLGRFKTGTGDTLWVGIQESQELISLYEKITWCLKKREFPVEEQRFKAHLTLGRGIRLNKDINFAELAQKAPKQIVPVDTIHLMNSHRVEGKLTYTSLFESSLNKF